MSFLLASAIFLCPQLKFENWTKEPVNEYDIKHYRIAKRRCGEIYKKSPCIKLFRKRTSSDYSVICGAGFPPGSTLFK